MLYYLWTLSLPALLHLLPPHLPPLVLQELKEGNLHLQISLLISYCQQDKVLNT